MSKIRRGFIAITRRRRNDEAGAILVIATVGFVLAVIASALAVDLGRLAQERRRDQKVADMAALDAARDMLNMQGRAEQSAVRNGFPLGTPGFTVKAVEGKKVNGQCEEAIGAGTVCVTVNSPHKNSFLPGGNAVAARAVAGNLSGAGFCMGSALLSASLDDATTGLPVLNRVFGRWLTGPTGQATVLSYKGLADASVSWLRLQAALGAGTVNEMLTTDITMGQLLNATATAVNNDGVTSYDVYNDLIRFGASTTNQHTFKLGEYLSVASGYESKALDSRINIFELITGTAQVANKNNFFDMGTYVTLPVNLPAPLNTTANVTTKLGIKVIEAPQCYVGPKSQDGTTPQATTSQMEVTLTPHIDVDFSAPLVDLLSLITLGTTPLHIEGDMPIKYTAAGAEGLLADVRCASPQGIDVRVVSKPITTHAEGTLSVYSDGLALIPSNVRLNFIVQPTDVSTATGGPFNLVFNWANDFDPPDTDGQTTPGAPAAVNFTTSNVSANVGVAGLNITALTGITTGGTLNSVLNPILNPIFNAVANRIADPVLKALGVAVGPVNVTAPAQYFDPTSCGQPGLLQ